MNFSEYRKCKDNLGINQDKIAESKWSEEGEKPTKAKALFRKLEISEKDAIKQK